MHTLRITSQVPTSAPVSSDVEAIIGILHCVHWNHTVFTLLLHCCSTAAPPMDTLLICIYLPSRSEMKDAYASYKFLKRHGKACICCQVSPKSQRECLLLGGGLAHRGRRYTVCCHLSSVYCLLSTVCLLSAVICLLSAVRTLHASVHTHQRAL
jgi:hypothetical protein